MTKLPFHGIAAGEPVVARARCHQEVVLSFLVIVSVSGISLPSMRRHFRESTQHLYIYFYYQYGSPIMISVLVATFWFRSGEVSNLDFELYYPSTVNKVF